MGVWAGRILEETVSDEANTELVKTIRQIWDDAVAKGETDQFVNVADPKIKDRVYRDAWDTLGWRIKAEAEEAFGARDTFMVRRDMIDDAIGYRAVSVTDPWTGVSRWSEEGLKTTREFLELIGPGLYKRLRQGENLVTDFVSWAKTTIIVRFSSDPSAVYIQKAVMAHIAKVFRSGTHRLSGCPRTSALRQARSRSRARAMP